MLVSRIEMPEFESGWSLASCFHAQWQTEGNASSWGSASCVGDPAWAPGSPPALVVAGILGANQHMGAPCFCFFFSVIK